MSFVQVMECRTSAYDEIAQLEKQWRTATEGKRTLRRAITTRDRNDPDHYVILAFFDDYESAMANSQLPETQEFAAKLASLAKEPMAFGDMDVVNDES